MTVEDSDLPETGWHQLDLLNAGETVAETRTWALLPDSSVYGAETIDGVETKLLTFYPPSKSGQSEAWFAWGGRSGHRQPAAPSDDRADALGGVDLTDINEDSRSSDPPSILWRRQPQVVDRGPAGALRAVSQTSSTAEWYLQCSGHRTGPRFAQRDDPLTPALARTCRHRPCSASDTTSLGT